MEYYIGKNLLNMGFYVSKNVMSGSLQGLQMQAFNKNQYLKFLVFLNIKTIFFYFFKFQGKNSRGYLFEK